MSTVAPVRRVPFGRKLGFGVGGIADGLHSAGVNTFLLLYYQQILGLPGSLAGAALFIAMVFDAVSDPLVGSFSDHLRTRFGRRHPLLLAAAIPLGLSFYALFSPPAGLSESGLFMWLVCFAVLVRVTLTFYDVPHSALGAEMAVGYEDRSTIFSVSTAFRFVGGIVGAFAAYTFFFPETAEYRPGTLNPDGYTALGATFGITMALAIFACVAGTWREIGHLRTRMGPPPAFDVSSTLRNVATIFSNRSFLMLFSGAVFGALTLNIDEILTPYMGLHFWELRTDELRWLPFGALMGLPLSLLIARYLPRLIDKRNTVLFCLFVFSFVANVPVFLRLLDVSWFPENRTPELFSVLFGRGVLIGCFAPTAVIMLASMLADICDEIELESGLRLEGLVFSTRSFALKITSGIGNWIGGVILQLIAFPTQAAVGTVAPDVVFKLGLVVGPFGVALGSLGLGFYLLYKLDRTRHAEIAEQIRQARAATLAPEWPDASASARSPQLQPATE